MGPLHLLASNPMLCRVCCTVAMLCELCNLKIIRELYLL